MQPKSVLKTLITPFQKFIELEASSGILLLLTTAVAVVWANSPWANGYFALWETEVLLAFGASEFSLSLHHLINDGLMAIFFFLVGLEIKREIMEGELSSPRKAALPMLAALGGMVIPVALFFLLYQGGPGSEGWGIPMATDIAFSLGILGLLGNRISLGMNVFLTAFAIVDDIGAVLIIAFFYSHDIQPTALLYGCGILGLLLALNFLGVKNIWIYGGLTFLCWYFFLQSGIHATIAGVLAAFCIPSVNKITLQHFVDSVRERVRHIRKRWESEPEGHFLPDEDLEEIEEIKAKASEVEPPLQRLEAALDHFVVYFVVPLFALANAGVKLSGGDGPLLSNLGLSLAGALVLGKALGIYSFSWIAVKTRLAFLPKGTVWRHMLGLSVLGGVGFTMALFIANLAYGSNVLLEHAKIGILLGSLLSGIIGYLILRFTDKKTLASER